MKIKLALREALRYLINMIKNDNNEAKENNMSTTGIIAIGRRMNNLQNEGAEGYDHTDRTALVAARKIERDAHKAEWSLDVTIARRAEWNATTRKLTTAGAQVTPKSVAVKLGYSMADLTASVRRHKLA